MKKLIIPLAATLLTVLTALNTSAQVTIHGRIENLGGDRVELCDRDKNVLAVADTDGDNYTLTADIPTGDGRFYYLYVPALGNWGNLAHRPALSFMVDSNNVRVDATAHRSDNYLEAVSVAGSPMHDRFYAIFGSTPMDEQMGPAIADYNRYFTLYNHTEGGMTDENLLLLSQASDRLDSLQAAKNAYFLDNIGANNTDIAYAAVIWEIYSSSPYQQLETIYGAFDPSIRESYPLSQMAARMEQIRSSSTGSAAPEFLLTDLDGNQVSLSSLRGKYVLIDFWASWCGPCLREIPNIVAIYEEYKDREDFQVVGISIDQDENKWRGAVAEKELPYLQLFDPKATTTKLYNYQGIPFLLIISPDGTILERGIRGPKIREAVTRYLD